MAAKASVEAISTVNFDNINRRLSDVERRVFVKHERRILNTFKKAWVGWLYKGRPIGAERNVSLKAWRSEIETTDGAHPVLRIINDKDYSGFVHRSGSNDLEWQVIWERVQLELIPPLVTDLKRAIEDELNKPSNPKKLGPRGGGKTTRMEITL